MVCTGSRAISHPHETSSFASPARAGFALFSLGLPRVRRTHRFSARPGRTERGRVFEKRRRGFAIRRPRRGYACHVGLLLYLILLFFIGLFVGALARLLLPGPDPMSIGMTALVGICGTFSAGLFSWYVLHRHGAGLVVSVLFSMLVVWIYRRSQGGFSGRRGPRRL